MRHSVEDSSAKVSENTSTDLDIIYTKVPAAGEIKKCVLPFNVACVASCSPD